MHTRARSSSRFSSSCERHLEKVDGLGVSGQVRIPLSPTSRDSGFSGVFTEVAHPHTFESVDTEQQRLFHLSPQSNKLWHALHAFYLPAERGVTKVERSCGEEKLMPKLFQFNR